MDSHSYPNDVFFADYYLGFPTKEYENEFFGLKMADDMKKIMVPIIRIFGSTPSGQKCCLHVHNVYPHFYIKLSDDFIEKHKDLKNWLIAFEECCELKLRDAKSHPDKCTAIFNVIILIDVNVYSSKSDGSDYIRINNDKSTTKHSKFISHLKMIKAVDIYGYHESEELFNPYYVKLLSSLLVTGQILQEVYQPYEAHLQYILQFMVDNNLFGMDLLYSNKFRAPLPTHGCINTIELPLNQRTYTTSSIPISMIREYTPYEKKLNNNNTNNNNSNNNNTNEGKKNEKKKTLVDPIYYGAGRFMRQTSITTHLLLIACELECDVDVSDILNTKIITEYQQKLELQKKLDNNNDISSVSTSYSSKLPSLQGAIDEDKRLRDVFKIGSQPSLIISEIKERKQYSMTDTDRIWYEKVALIIEESHKTDNLYKYPEFEIKPPPVIPSSLPTLPIGKQSMSQQMEDIIKHIPNSDDEDNKDNEDDEYELAEDSISYCSQAVDRITTVDTHHHNNLPPPSNPPTNSSSNQNQNQNQNQNPDDDNFIPPGFTQEECMDIINTEKEHIQDTQERKFLQLYSHFDGQNDFIDIDNNNNNNSNNSNKRRTIGVRRNRSSFITTTRLFKPTVYTPLLPSVMEEEDDDETDDEKEEEKEEEEEEEEKNDDDDEEEEEKEDEPIKRKEEIEKDIENTKKRIKNNNNNIKSKEIDYLYEELRSFVTGRKSDDSDFDSPTVNHSEKEKEKENNSLNITPISLSSVSSHFMKCSPSSPLLYPYYAPKINNTNKTFESAIIDTSIEDEDEDDDEEKLNDSFYTRHTKQQLSPSSFPDKIQKIKIYSPKINYKKKYETINYQIRQRCLLKEFQDSLFPLSDITVSSQSEPQSIPEETSLSSSSQKSNEKKKDSFDPQTPQIVQKEIPDEESKIQPLSSPIPLHSPKYIMSPPSAFSPQLRLSSSKKKSESISNQSNPSNPSNPCSNFSQNSTPKSKSKSPYKTHTPDKKAINEFNSMLINERPVNRLRYLAKPPSSKHLLSTLDKYHLPHHYNQPAFCSDPDDIPSKFKSFRGKVLKIDGPYDNYKYLPEFNVNLSFKQTQKYQQSDSMIVNDVDNKKRKRLNPKELSLIGMSSSSFLCPYHKQFCCSYRLIPTLIPPSPLMIRLQYKKDHPESEKSSNGSSSLLHSPPLPPPSSSSSSSPNKSKIQLDKVNKILYDSQKVRVNWRKEKEIISTQNKSIVTPPNKSSSNLSADKKVQELVRNKDGEGIHDKQYFTIMSIDVFCKTRDNLSPDPLKDTTTCIFYYIRPGGLEYCNDKTENDLIGYILLEEEEEEEIETEDQIEMENVKQETIKTEEEDNNKNDNVDGENHLDFKDANSFINSPEELMKNMMKCRHYTNLSDDIKDILEYSKILYPKNYYPKNYTKKYSLNMKNEMVFYDIVHSEYDLFLKLVEIVHCWDPDFLVGYETQASSWGYLFSRSVVIDFPFLQLIGRTPYMAPDHRNTDTYDKQKGSGISFIGRVVLNIWRLFKKYMDTLRNYTLEKLVSVTLHKVFPVFKYKQLTDWFLTPELRCNTIDYYLKRVKVTIELIDSIDIINQSCEFSRLYGIPYSQQIIRGSQYVNEAFIFRLAKPLNFILASPSNEQVACQKPLECLPLVLEPSACFHHHPIVVLDFQSLYPSIMSAYNMCYSTCLGRISHGLEPMIEPFLGPLNYVCDTKILEKFKDDIFISPNGVVFVKPNIRRGVMPTMEDLILSIRILIKKTMKHLKNEKYIYGKLGHREHALKMVANTSYGYVAASYSGRMPCSEIADSIVETAKETLLRAMNIVEKEFGGKVMYGDTDSMFIEFEGKSVKESYEIAQEICKRVTSMNPYPVQLKYEKIYYPCILASKKRYVGYKYENPDEPPEFEAKGIEVIRRDNCDAVKKIEEKALMKLFTTKDLSNVKRYVQNQFIKILSDHVCIKDFIFSKEVRLGRYSTRGPPPPSAIVALNSMKKDYRTEPLYKQRIPYVVVYGEPGSRICDLVVSPLNLLNNSSYHINGIYYITHQIVPSLARLFDLIGCDVLSWYNELKRPREKSVFTLSDEDYYRILKNPGDTVLIRNGQNKISEVHGTIDQYYESSYCCLCDELTTNSICDKCLENKQQSLYFLIMKSKRIEREYFYCLNKCSNCVYYNMNNFECLSLECENMYQKNALWRKLKRNQCLLNDLSKIIDIEDL